MSHLVLKLVVIGGIATHQASAQSTKLAPNPFLPDTPGGSHAATDLRVFGPNSDGWLFPITRLDELLPHWIQFGGQEPRRKCHLNYRTACCHQSSDEIPKSLAFDCDQSDE
jgi:hypothetical protein